MKLTKSTDEFELQQCIDALGRFLIDTHSTLYDFSYYLTFKKSLKSLACEFKDPNENHIFDIEFFEDIDDPIVRHSMRMWNLIVDYLTLFLKRYGLDDVQLLEDDNAEVQAKRYAPLGIRRKSRSSYKREAVNYRFYGEQLSNSFYYYACALSVQSYRIPFAMRVQVEYSNSGSFRLLNIENYEVASLIGLIDNLQEKQLELEKLMIKKWW
jgi:hypothetical protein